MLKQKISKILFLSVFSKILMLSCLFSMKEQGAGAGSVDNSHRSSIKRTVSMFNLASVKERAEVERKLKRQGDFSKRRQIKANVTEQSVSKPANEVVINIPEKEAKIVIKKTFWQRHKNKIIFGVAVTAVVAGVIVAEYVVPGCVSGTASAVFATVKDFFMTASPAMCPVCPEQVACPAPSSCPAPQISAQDLKLLKECVTQSLHNSAPLMQRLTGEIVPKACADLPQHLIDSLR